MADSNKQAAGTNRINPEERFRYIGFDVFPGKPKDLFTSDAERQRLVQEIEAKRQKGEMLREACTLVEERVSAKERIVLTIAALAVLVSLIFPWYSVYNETVVEPTPVAQAAPATGSSNEEVISGFQAKKKVTTERRSLMGVEGLTSLGSVGGAMFSSGITLSLTAILMLLFTLACIALPIKNLMTIYRARGNPDERALELKRVLRLNWVPVILFLLAFVLSFVGGDYGFNAAGTFSSLGTSYGPGVFLGSLGSGILLALGGSILLALKGIEI